jgi:predicted aspartyl protease
MFKTKVLLAVVLVLLTVILFGSFEQKEKKMPSKETLTETYDLEVLNGHLVAMVDGKKVLIDTGSPISGGKFYSKVWGNVDKGNSVVFIPFDYLKKLAKVDFDAYAGMDILCKSNFSISLEKKQMVVTNGDIQGEGELIEMSSVLGTPVLPLSVSGKKLKLLVDTGSSITYIPKNLVKDLTPIKEVEDFYPLLGNFKTPVYNVEIEINNQKATLECGVLPAVLDLQVKLLGDGILGNNILKYFNADFLMLQKKKAIRFSPAPKKLGE